jgi:WD40-like Beta Propeller Repeat
VASRALLALAVAAAASAALSAPAMAAFPGLNGKIAFARDDQIVTKTPGSVVSDPPLTSTGLGHGNNSDPAWSPDGSRIAFSSDRNGNGFEIWTMNADGSGQTRVTFELEDAGAPAWSPGGTGIAFHVGPDGAEDVVVVNANGTGRLLVAGGDGSQSLPVWSPDGSRIVFQDDQVPGLGSVTASGTGRAPFVSDATQPDFSPDGTRLAVRRNLSVFILNADGTGGFQITPGPGVRPAWSPDGTRLVYNRFVAGNSEDLFTIATSPGSPEAPETSTPALDVAPDWQPIPRPAAASPPAQPAPSAPPGGLALSSARFAPKWTASRIGGTLVLAGSVARPASLQAQVLRANGKGKPLLTRSVRLTRVGAFTLRLALAGSRLLPGRYVVRLVEVGSGTGLASRDLLARLAAPPEGVVSRALVSTALGGRARPTITKGPSVLFASFRFAALPARGKRLTVTWYSSARPGPVSSAPKPRAPRVNAVLKALGPLPAARYRAELRAGTTLVAVARTRVR